MTRQRTIIVSILILGVIIGAFREFVFVNLNYQLDHLVRHTEFSYAHSKFQNWVLNWDEKQLSILKWTASVFFMLAMFLLCISMARALLGTSRYDEVVVVFFLAIAILSFLLHCLGGDNVAMRSVSIKLLHLLQYPAILLVLLGASTLRKKG